MTNPWPTAEPGVVVLPSGRRVRGRSLRGAVGEVATWSVQLSGTRPDGFDADLGEWVRWRDFWLPADPDQAVDVLARALGTASTERVEVGCPGGVGRTGTALAAMAVLDGADPDHALAWVRESYHPRAVEVPWQRRFLRYAAASGRQDPSG